MPIEEFLFPKEVIKYSGTETVEHEGSRYDFFITDRRMILHAVTGIQSKQERIVSEKLPEIENMHYEEKGVFNKIGILKLETKRKKMDLSGSRDNIKAIMKELQKYKELAQSIRRQKASAVDVTLFTILLAEGIQALLPLAKEATTTDLASAKVLHAVQKTADFEITIGELLKLISGSCGVLEESLKSNIDTNTREQRKAVMQKLVELQARIECA